MFFPYLRPLRQKARFRAPAELSTGPAGAPEHLRAQVLAGVRGEAGQAERDQLDLSHGALYAATMASLLVGIVIGGALALTLAFGGHATSMPPRAAGGIRASLTPLGSRAELSVSGMPQPPIGEVYEVWLMNAGQAKPQPTDALFNVTNAGTATVDVPRGATSGVREVLVTSEPLGGSQTPTGAPLLRVKPPGPR
jgi:hypothetical protein